VPVGRGATGVCETTVNLAMLYGMSTNAAEEIVEDTIPFSD